MKKYLITLIVAASVVIHAQAAEPKNQEEDGGKAQVTGKIEDISAQPIPGKPAAGKVHGKEFKIEKATLEDDCLKLRKGEGFASHLEEFEIDFRGKNGGNHAGKHSR